MLSTTILKHSAVAQSEPNSTVAASLVNNLVLWAKMKNDFLSPTADCWLLIVDSLWGWTQLHARKLQILISTNSTHQMQNKWKSVTRRRHNAKCCPKVSKWARKRASERTCCCRTIWGPLPRLLAPLCASCAACVSWLPCLSGWVGVGCLEKMELEMEKCFTSRRWQHWARLFLAINKHTHMHKHTHILRIRHGARRSASESLIQIQSGANQINFAGCHNTLKS